MEKIGLGIQENYDRILRKEKFLKIKYPLSELGEKLKQRILSGENIEDGELPTVENPKPELFKDFDLTEEEKTELFGENLANIQVSKGCTHQCTFCAAGSDKEVKIMPFAAILKIAKEKKDIEPLLKERITLVENLFLDCKKEIKEKTGYSTWQINKMREILKTENVKEFADIIKKAISIYNNHPFKNTAKKYASKSIYCGDNCLPSFFLINSIHSKLSIENISNYFDSDVFDYRDGTFLHDDGSPADYGDVAKLLASELRPIHITTAGWPRTDKIAQKAADKISNMNPNLFQNIRLSVNQTEIRARKNLDEYFEDTINTIMTLAPLGLKIIFINNEKDWVYSEMGLRLKNFVENLKNNKIHIIYSTAISAYSGHIKEEERKEEDNDVMACMDGFHIWPDGIIAEQERDPNPKEPFTAPKGARPKPTGKVLW